MYPITPPSLASSLPYNSFFCNAYLLSQLKSMASSSSSPAQQNEEHHAFSGIEPPYKRRKVSESSRLFDVFINHRGPDVKQNLATQLYNSLHERGIRAFLDSEEMELGDSFPSTIETAIRSAAVHIAIFSKNYAQSPWCLAELVLMQQSRAKIFPVFYYVQPWELRHIEKGVYAEAFIDYENKSRYLEKIKEWKEALQSVSFITGEEFNGDCKYTVSAVQKEVQRLKPKLHVAAYPVGLPKLVQDFERRCLNELVDDFERHCTIEKDKGNAQIIGIFGMGGVGKTTLSKELFNRKRSQYSSVCFLFDVREASAKREFPSLQMKLVGDIFHKYPPNFRSIEEGMSYIVEECKERSSLSSFLIVLDDIDHVKQLNDLMIKDILNKADNSLVIVTTRDVGVLINTGITIGYNLKAMDRETARELFCWHAFRTPHPASKYEDLVEAFLDVCGDLPLSLEVLGSHVHGRDQNYWSLELKKVREILPRDIQQRLKISFDALDREEKQIFMDVACFFIDQKKNMALRIWEGSLFNAEHALQTLKDKCLVEEIVDGPEGTLLRMHDHLRDLGREMANELSPPHRVWHPEHIESLALKGFKAILSKSDWRCFGWIVDRSMDATIRFFIGNSNDWGHASASLIWLEIDFHDRRHRSIPSWIPLKNLQCLRIKNGNLEKLLQSDVQELSSLKELNIEDTILGEFPDLSRISNQLEKLVLNREDIPIEWWSFLDSVTTIPTVTTGYRRRKFITFESSSSCVRLDNFQFSGIVALNNRGLSSSLESPMSALQKVELEGQDYVTKVLISGYHYPNLESLHLCDMENLTEVDLNTVTTLKSFKLIDCKSLKSLSRISDLTNLVELEISGCSELKKLAGLSHLSFLNTIKIERCEKLNCVELDDCANLEVVHLSSLPKLVILSIRHCPKLEEFSRLHGLSSLEQITIDGCGKVKFIALRYCEKLKSLSGMKIKMLEITGCPKVELLPTTLTYLRVKGQNEWKTVPAISDLTKLKSLIITECEELEELCVAGLSFLETVTIERCEKLQNIAGIEELLALKDMQISPCSDGAIRSSIDRLQRVPSEQMIAIERAAEEAESKLGPHLFSEWIATEKVIELDTEALVETMPDRDRDSVGAIIYCAVVMVEWEGDTFSLPGNRKLVLIGSRSLSSSSGGETGIGEIEWSWTTDQEKIIYATGFGLCNEERGSSSDRGLRLLTSSPVDVMSNEEQGSSSDQVKMNYLPQFLMCCLMTSWETSWRTTRRAKPTIEKAYMVKVNKDEEWKTLHVIKMISDHLFKK